MQQSYQPASIFGVPIQLLDLGKAEALLDGLALRGAGSDVHLCNTYTISLAHKDKRLHGVLSEADANLADGVPVVWAARLLGHAVRRGVRGPDLFSSALFLEWGGSHRHYLFGGTTEVLALIRARLLAVGTHHRLVGAEAPPFRELTSHDYALAAERIRDSGADIVWVGLGTPKQDFAVSELKLHVSAVVVAVGAAYDFAAGTKPAAPAFLHHTGLEWVFRLGTEPRRLWRRYILESGPFMRKFLFAVVRRALGMK